MFFNFDNEVISLCREISFSSAGWQRYFLAYISWVTMSHVETEVVKVTRMLNDVKGHGYIYSFTNGVVSKWYFPSLDEVKNIPLVVIYFFVTGATKMPSSRWVCWTLWQSIIRNLTSTKFRSIFLLEEIEQQGFIYSSEEWRILIIDVILMPAANCVSRLRFQDLLGTSYMAKIICGKRIYSSQMSRTTPLLLWSCGKFD